MEKRNNQCWALVCALDWFEIPCWDFNSREKIPKEIWWGVIVKLLLSCYFWVGSWVQTFQLNCQYFFYLNTKTTTSNITFTAFSSVQAWTNTGKIVESVHASSTVMTWTGFTFICFCDKKREFVFLVFVRTSNMRTTFIHHELHQRRLRER